MLQNNPSIFIGLFLFTFHSVVLFFLLLSLQIFDFVVIISKVTEASSGSSEWMSLFAFSWISRSWSCCTSNLREISESGEWTMIALRFERCEISMMLDGFYIVTVCSHEWCLCLINIFKASLRRLVGWCTHRSNIGKSSVRLEVPLIKLILCFEQADLIESFLQT